MGVVEVNRLIVNQTVAVTAAVEALHMREEEEFVIFTNHATNHLIGRL